MLQYPQNHDILLCCLHILFRLNSDSLAGCLSSSLGACRDEVIHQEGIALLVRLTNLSQYDESVCCEAMKVIRCVCSAESSRTLPPSPLAQSLQSVIDANVMSSAIMCMSSYPHSREIITHGVRALEWVIHAGSKDVWKLMVDEGVGDVIVQALVEHDDDEILSFLSSLTVQLLQAMRNPRHATHPQGTLPPSPPSRRAPTFCEACTRPWRGTSRTNPSSPRSPESSPYSPLPVSAPTPPDA